MDTIEILSSSEHHFGDSEAGISGPHRKIRHGEALIGCKLSLAFAVVTSLLLLVSTSFVGETAFVMSGPLLGQRTNTLTFVPGSLSNYH